jgi:hypothetical protein
MTFIKVEFYWQFQEWIELAESYIGDWGGGGTPLGPWGSKTENLLDRIMQVFYLRSCKVVGLLPHWVLFDSMFAQPPYSIWNIHGCLKRSVCKPFYAVVFRNLERKYMGTKTVEMLISEACIKFFYIELFIGIWTLLFNPFFVEKGPAADATDAPQP